MIRLVVFARRGLARECLCSQLSGRDDVCLLAVGDDLNRLAGQVGQVGVDAVLFFSDDAGVAAEQTSGKIRRWWPEAAVCLGSFDPPVASDSEALGGFSRRISLLRSVDGVVKQLGGSVAAVADRPDMFEEVLLAREVKALEHLALGHSSRESADLLGLSSRTVDSYRRRVSEKLGLAGLAGLTRYAIASGLIEAGTGLLHAERPVAAACG